MESESILYFMQEFLENIESFLRHVGPCGKKKMRDLDVKAHLRLITRK